MAVNAPDADEFDREDLELAPETHQALAEMAAERDEEYDPYAYERRMKEHRSDNPDPIEDVEAVDGVDEAAIERWKNDA